MHFEPTRRAALVGGAALTLAACNPMPKTRQPAFSPAGLGRLELILESHIAKGSVPGLVGLVRRGGETHAWALGNKALEGADPMRRDTIFRMASMTKAVTAVAALMLVDEGKLRLDESVEQLAPELADRRVLRTAASPLDDTVPANRPITVEDVLSFRLGWGVSFDDTPFNRAVADLPGFGMPNPAAPYTPDSFMKRLGELPLQAQPGEQWLYTTGSNVLGVLIARASGQPLEVFFEERIFGPLGMKDTGFHAPADRLPVGYLPMEGKLTVYDAPDGLYARKPTFPAGDSGLVSTADDFAAFASFMEAGLAPDGRRLLSEASLKTITTNRLTPEQRKGGALILGPHRGWGGIGVYVEPSPEGIPAGAYGWGGGFGTTWFNDPSRGLTAILLTQRFFDSPDEPQIHKDFWKAAIAAAA